MICRSTGTRMMCAAKTYRFSVHIELKFFFSCYQFPHADKEAVLKKVSGQAKEHISSLQAAFREQDPANSGNISLQQFMYIGFTAEPLLSLYKRVLELINP